MHNADYTTEYEVENKFIDIIKEIGILFHLFHLMKI